MMACREAIKRIFSAYEERGTEESILKAADYSISDDWVAGDIFLTKDKVPPRAAIIEYPGRKLFRHSISKFSGPDKYADSSRWRNGVIIIKVDSLNNKVREAIKTVVPAGVRYYFDLYFSMGSEGEGSGQYGEVSFHSDIVNDYYAIVYDMVIDISLANMKVFSSRPGGLLSGKQTLFMAWEIEKHLNASFVPGDRVQLTEEEL